MRHGRQRPQHARIGNEAIELLPALEDSRAQPVDAVDGTGSIQPSGERVDPSVPYAAEFEAAGERYGISPRLLAAVARVESSYRPDAVSGAGAIGIMQLMPSTAAGLGVDPYEPVASIHGAARLLRDLQGRFGRIELALGAYNVGPGTISRAGGIQPGSQAEKYVNDLNWTKGIDPETGKPVDYNPKLDVQIYNPEARALRGDPKKRTCPTWHGGVAHQPMAYNPVKKIAYGVGTEGCFSQNGAAVGVLSKDGGIDSKKSEQRQYSSDLYYGSLTAFDSVNHKVLAKAVTEIEIRSGALATAGGLVFTALQDGWVVAYNDETLEELWRFNVGTPLKGAPVTYAIGPKQYLAVQAGGRHLHPVNWDKLQNSSYLFVFALN